MKYLSLPINLIEFWYPEGIAFFVRTWKNLMLFLEEDLAVGLMWRLIFTPLFHDATIVGRILSFLFRISRILMGLFAFFVATIILLIIGGYWLMLPVLAFFDTPIFLSRILVFSGAGLFLINFFIHPHKKVWSADLDDLWPASEIKKEDLSFKKLLSTYEVSDILSNLEIELKGLPDFEIKDKEKLIKEAFALAKQGSSRYISARHFFVAFILEIPNIDQFLLKLELTPQDFKSSLAFIEKKKQTWRRVWIWDEDFAVHHLKGINRGWLGIPTPSLDLVSEDLTKSAAKSGDSKFIRSSSVIQDVINILSQTSGKNVILVGPPGAGKTALIRHLAKMIVAGDAPDALATKRLVMLDLTRLLSGVKTQGDLAERIKDIFDEISFAQNVILVIDEIHELGLGEAGGSFNLYSLMQPYLESDTFQFLGITEAENYARILEKNSSFVRIFRKVEMSPASKEETLDVLEYRSIDLERKSKIKITLIALKTAIELSQKFIKDRVLPDSAIAVLKEAQTQAVGGWVNKEIIKRVVSSRVKVPLVEVGTADKDKLLNLESEIHGRMIDQEQAVKVVSDTLRRSVTGLREEDRPLGSFLFVGPTGVGKCVTPDTILFTEKGILTIGDFVPTSDFPEDTDRECNISLYSIKGLERTSRIYNGGIKKTLCIKTRLGYEIEGTLVHPILIFNKNGKVVFKKLKDVKKGDHVIIQRNQKYFGQNLDLPFEFKKSPYDHSSSDKIHIPQKLSKRIARLLGYLVGEATTNIKNAVRFSNSDPFVIQDVRNILANEFNLDLFHYESDHEIDYWIHSVKFRSFLAFCGIDYVKANQKEIPGIILRASKEIVAEYLRGFFEAEGSIGLSNHRIELSSASEKMTKQLHILLLNFGVVVNRRKTFNKRLKRNYHRLEIFGENINIFADEIGFISSRKQEALNKLINVSRNPNIDVIPHIKSKLIALKKRYLEEGYNYAGNSHVYLQNWYKREISYSTLSLLLRLHENIHKTPEFQSLEKINQSNYLYLPVVEITSGINQVYDFVVPETHSFTSNGFISHNTELAKTLAEVYFKDKGAFLRFDMSEFQNPESVVRLIGGQGEGGLLTEAVRGRPYALLLLDEFEKANDKILTLFLQVLDDGRLTDGAGRTIGFENTIIIATSNAGSLLIAQGLQQGQSMERIDKQINDELLKVFKPELVNRFDDIVIFKPLSYEDLQKIVTLKLTSLQNQMKQKGYIIDFSDGLVAELGKRGFDPVLGARPLRRLIQDTLEANLSKLILENQLTKGQPFKAGVELLS